MLHTMQEGGGANWGKEPCCMEEEMAVGWVLKRTVMRSITAVKGQVKEGSAWNEAMLLATVDGIELLFMEQKASERWMLKWQLNKGRGVKKTENTLEKNETLPLKTFTQCKESERSLVHWVAETDVQIYGALLSQLTSKRDDQRFKVDSSNSWFTSRVRKCLTD